MIITSLVALNVMSLIKVVKDPRIVIIIDMTLSSVTVVSFGAGTIVASEVMVLVRVVDL